MSEVKGGGVLRLMRYGILNVHPVRQRGNRLFSAIGVFLVVGGPFLFLADRSVSSFVAAVVEFLIGLLLLRLGGVRRS